MKNTAKAKWFGTGQDGNGQLNTQSGALKQTPYSYSTRMGNTAGTNPEELIAAAHAGCFAMKLAFVLSAAGYQPEELDVTCEVDFVGGKISGSVIHLKAKIKEISKTEFDELVQDAGLNCPVSQLLSTTTKVKGELVAGE